MKTALTETDSQNVLLEQQERLHAFRMAHPREQIDLSGTTWNYLLARQGTETLLLLPGGELVDGLAALLERLSIGRVILFAASFGGDVGQCFVRKYPDRVSMLILLNTGVPDERLGKATQRSKPLVTLLPMGIVRFLVKKLLVKALSVRPEERLFWQSMMHELVGQLTRADMVSSFDETIDYRLNYHFTSADLANWPGKVLILQSDDDPAIKPAMRLALRNLYPQAQIHTFHRAGHTPFLFQPDEFYPHVRAFLHE